MSTSQLSNLRRKGVFYRHDAPEWAHHIWPRPESLDWFIKSNRDYLIEQGALVKIGRDHFVDISVFPEAAARVLGVTLDQDKG